MVYIFGNQGLEMEKSGKARQQHQTTEETRMTIHVEPVLKSRRNRNDKTAKRGMAVLHQYP
jgi:hypothetical protein